MQSLCLQTCEMNRKYLTAHTGASIHAKKIKLKKKLK